MLSLVLYIFEPDKLLFKYIPVIENNDKTFGDVKPTLPVAEYDILLNPNNLKASLIKESPIVVNDEFIIVIFPVLIDTDTVKFEPNKFFIKSLNS